MDSSTAKDTRLFTEQHHPHIIPMSIYLIALFMFLFLAITSQVMYQALELTIEKVFNDQPGIEWVHIFNFIMVSLLFLALFIILIKFIVPNPLSAFY